MQVRQIQWGLSIVRGALGALERSDGQKIQVIVPFLLSLTSVVCHLFYARRPAPLASRPARNDKWRK